MIPAVVGPAHDDVQALFRLRYLGLVRLAMRLVDDQETAEDLVQEVFLTYAQQRRVPDDPLAYLRAAVVNRSRSVLRRRRLARAFHFDATQQDADAADHTTLRQDETRRMLDAIAGLPARQREVVVLRFYEELTVTEIAGLLQTSTGAISSALHRAMTTLATVWETDHAD